MIAWIGNIQNACMNRSHPLSGYDTQAFGEACEHDCDGDEVHLIQK